MDRDNYRRHHGSTYFLKYLHEMVGDHSTDPIVSWSDNGKSFIVWNESEFCRNVLPSFLMYNKMAPFVCRLVRLGFKKIESETQCEFASDYFVRGHPEIEPPPEALVYPTPPDDPVERLKKVASAIRKREAKKQAKREAEWRRLHQIHQFAKSKL